MNAELREDIRFATEVYHAKFHPGYPTVAECENPRCVNLRAASTPAPQGEKSGESPAGVAYRVIIGGIPDRAIAEQLGRMMEGVRLAGIEAGKPRAIQATPIRVTEDVEPGEDCSGHRMGECGCTCHPRKAETP